MSVMKKVIGKMFGAFGKGRKGNTEVLKEEPRKSESPKASDDERKAKSRRLAQEVAFLMREAARKEAEVKRLRELQAKGLRECMAICGSCPKA